MIISFIHILNKRGPRIEPCGTPVLIDTIDELISSICTYCLRLDIGYMSQQTLPWTPPPTRTAEGGFIFFVSVSSVPQKMSSKESVCFSELFRLKDQKTWFSLYSLKTNFDKLNSI